MLNYPYIRLAGVPGKQMGKWIRRNHFRKVKINRELISGYKIDPKMTVKPRTEDPVWIPPDENKVKIPWTVKKSLFANY